MIRFDFASRHAHRSCANVPPWEPHRLRPHRCLRRSRRSPLAWGASGVASADGDAFELDEPAAHTHVPPGWPVMDVEISPSGKAPKAHGPNTYRFGASLTASVILPRRGWTLVGKTRNFAYLAPPSQETKPPFRISIAVPTPEECLGLARRSHEAGRSWMGSLGEWPAWYVHERKTGVRHMWRDPAGGGMKSEFQPDPPRSSLSIGERGIWHIEATGVDGRFAIGILPPGHGSASVALRTDEVVERSKPIMIEGGTRTVELTVYERDPEARRLCIEHYGPICQACGLVYEDRYGPIGADLIHVHHVVRLADLGGAHEVDPIRDLLPLCATCHHVTHRRVPPYTVEEIRQALASSSARTAAPFPAPYRPDDR